MVTQTTSSNIWYGEKADLMAIMVDLEAAMTASAKATKVLSKKVAFSSPFSSN